MFFVKKIDNAGVIDVASRIDFTLLDPRATDADLEKLCDIAYKNGYASVCVNSVNVNYVSAYIKKYLSDKIKIVSVIGFPFGANATVVKITEAKEAFDNGATEIDMVINIGKAKSGDFKYVKSIHIAWFISRWWRYLLVQWCIYASCYYRCILCYRIY